MMIATSSGTVITISIIFISSIVDNVSNACETTTFYMIKEDIKKIVFGCDRP
ncbi:hypothetical protein COCNU_07G014170 [Cocos nucifera]|uniref:Uncharacterized protein n=1 Tax=Cocos nucifera TaxID=13894 RepID=A0A8K0IG77_COCNU|nr:hypothetical protein COCNU_07G014170 [Cocos nucifera]